MKEVFPRRGFTLESIFNGQMTIAQHQRAIRIVHDCVEETNKRSVNRRAEAAREQQDASNPSGSIVPENKGADSEDSNPHTFGFMNRIGRGMLNVAEKFVPPSIGDNAKPLVPMRPIVGGRPIVF